MVVGRGSPGLDGLLAAIHTAPAASPEGRGEKWHIRYLKVERKAAQTASEKRVSKFIAMPLFCLLDLHLTFALCSASSQ